MACGRRVVVNRDDSVDNNATGGKREPKLPAGIRANVVNPLPPHKGKQAARQPMGQRAEDGGKSERQAVMAWIGAQ